MSHQRRSISAVVRLTMCFVAVGFVGLGACRFEPNNNTAGNPDAEQTVIRHRADSPPRDTASSSSGLAAMRCRPDCSNIRSLERSIVSQQSSSLAKVAPPPGWPATLELGINDGLGGAAAVRAMAPFGLRYQYLSGGVDTGTGWATWKPDGHFVTAYIEESRQHDMIPVFTYYMIAQSASGTGTPSEDDAATANLRSPQTMAAYFADLRLFFQRAGSFSSTVVLHVEPDLWGFAHQRATRDDAGTVAVKVAATMLPELAGLPDTMRGFAQAIVRLRDQYAPNVMLGYHLSIWGAGDDIAYTGARQSSITPSEQSSHSSSPSSAIEMPASSR
jgi:hypothetical protein